MALGDSDARRAGQVRVLHGLRHRDRRELLLGLVLSTVAYLQHTKPRKQLLYRKTVPEGAALVIHHKRSGEARLQITRGDRRRGR